MDGSTLGDSGFDAAVFEARLEAVRSFAYGAGHEINNPLANIGRLPSRWPIWPFGIGASCWDWTRLNGRAS